MFEALTRAPSTGPATMPDPAPILRMRNVSKTFPGVKRCATSNSPSTPAKSTR